LDSDGFLVNKNGSKESNIFWLIFQGQGYLRVARAGHWGLEGKAATW
jgi:hypothetical protein